MHSRLFVIKTTFLLAIASLLPLTESFGYYPASSRIRLNRHKIVSTSSTTGGRRSSFLCAGVDNEECEEKRRLRNMKMSGSYILDESVKRGSDILALEGVDLKKLIASTVGVASLATVLMPSMAHAALDLASFADGASTATAFFDQISETGFYQAFSLVFLSEIGDKTFFIAGLLAMKTSRLVSFLGSIGALAVMTILSVLIGQAFHAVPAGISQGIPLDDVAAVLAFSFFGFKTLKDAFEIDNSDETSTMDEELAEAEETVESSETIKKTTVWAQIISTFALVFAAEFGDRSFLSTIALSAAQSPIAVAGGAIAAHGVATGVAVAGGSYIAKYISEKVIGYISGTLFLLFAVTTAIGIF